MLALNHWPVLVFLCIPALLAGCRREDAPAAGRPGITGENQTVGVSPPPALGPAVLAPEVRKVSVDQLIRRPADFAGLVAVHGAVVQCDEQRGAFVMVNEEEFRSCGLKACTEEALPVRIDRQDFEGVLPPPGLLVTLVGEFQPLDRGFRFDLNEVHHQGSIILARRAGPGG